MNNKQGFSLMSFLIYLMVFTIIASCACHVITVLIIPSLKLTRMHTSRISLHSATDLFVQDMRATDKCIWKTIKPHKLLWNNGKNDVAWDYKGNKLERIEGKYGQKKWKKKIKSIIALDLSDVLFSPEYSNGKIIGVELTLISEQLRNIPVVCYVSVKQS